MRGWISTRLGVALVIAGLLAGSLAGPVSAAVTERWVDDDSSPGDGPAACDTAAFSSIQAAIDASNNWDHVNVCPGYYEEQLTLDVRGILVQAVPLRKAHIVAPALMAVVDGITSLVRMTEWAARLNGFRIDIPAGEAPAPTIIPTCSTVDVAVLALGERNRVRWNVIDAIGDATFSGNCGYAYGIVFTDSVLPPAFGAPYPTETSRATHNTVRDFKWGGILIEGARMVRVDRNKIRFMHADDPGCLIYNISPCFPTTAQPTEVNSSFPLSFGIGVEDGALADIQANNVRSTFSNVVQVTINSISLSDGIRLLAAHADSRVRGNTVTGAQQGISVGGGIIVLPPVQASSTAGVEINGNTLTGNGAGLEVASDENDVHHNESHNNAAGIVVVNGESNLIHDNDARNNHEVDCYDNTSGGGTSGTANWWTDNLGNTSSPSGLCN